MEKDVGVGSEDIFTTILTCGINSNISWDCLKCDSCRLVRQYVHLGRGNSTCPFAGFTRTKRSLPCALLNSTRYQFDTVRRTAAGSPHSRFCSFKHAIALILASSTVLTDEVNSALLLEDSLISMLQISLFRKNNLMCF